MNTHQKNHVEGLGFSSARIFSPLELVDRIPRSEAAAKTVEESREIIQNILNGTDDRLMIITGPCSIHDESAALDYANRLVKLRESLSEKVYICLLYTSPSPRDQRGSRMPSSA